CFFGHDVTSHEGIHNLPVETEGLQHFRIKLTPHAIDIIAVSRLKLMGSDAVTSNRRYIIGNIDVRQIAKGDIERYERHAEYENEDHPHPFQSRALTPHKIQHRWSSCGPVLKLNSAMLAENFGRRIIAFQVLCTNISVLVLPSIGRGIDERP